MENNQKQNIKYFIYARKSSESDEKQVQSIDNQISIMKELAKDMNLRVVEIYKESKSAKDPGARIVFGEMIEKIKEGKANGILTWKIDRLSRNPIDSATIQWLLQKEIIKSIQTIGREYVSEDNALILGVESSMANQYIRDLSKNVKRGLKSKLDKGWMPGTAPLGYLNTKTENRGENYIVKDEERFPLIRKAWDLMLTGNYVPQQILNKLNNEWGFRTRSWKKKGKKPMSRSTIYRIFTNPFYAGIIPYKDLYVAGKHPKMITSEEFDKVQIILGRKGKPRPNRYQYAYTGLLTCGECGGFVSATYKEKVLKSTGELKRYTLYYCVNARKNKGSCSQNHYTNAEELEKEIDSELKKITILPTFKEWALDILEAEHKKEVEERTKIYEAQQKILNDTQKQLDNLTQMRIKELINDDEYTREKNRIKNEVSRIKENMGNVEMRADTWLSLVEKTFDFACSAREKFANGDLETKKEILSIIGLNCDLKDHKLNIQSPEWTTTIKKQYPAIEERIKEFELEKTPYNKRQKEAFTSLSPLVRSRRDLNP